MHLRSHKYLTIAGFGIEINFLAQKNNFYLKRLEADTSDYYQNFIKKDQGKIDYKITVVEKNGWEIIKKKKKGSIINYIDFYRQINRNEILTYDQISFFHLQYLLREVLQQLLSRNQGFMLHASAVLNKKILMFLGRANVGKSTIVNLLKDKYLPLADDSLIVKKENGKFYLYQTPFIETNRYISRNNKSYPVGALFLLHKSKIFRLVKIADKEKIIPTISLQLWADPDEAKKQIKTLLGFVNQYDIFDLYFAKNKKKLLSLFRSLTHKG